MIWIIKTEREEGWPEGLPIYPFMPRGILRSATTPGHGKAEIPAMPNRENNI
jgi:hypothetical protein